MQLLEVPYCNYYQSCFYEKTISISWSLAKSSQFYSFVISKFRISHSVAITHNVNNFKSTHITINSRMKIFMIYYSKA